MEKKKEAKKEIRKIEINFRPGLLVSLLEVLIVVFFFQIMLFVPINLHSGAFLTELLIIIGILYLYLAGRMLRPEGKGHRLVLLYIPIIVLGLFLLGCMGGTPYTGGLNNYKNQSVIEESDFSKIPEFDATQVQLVDKNTAQQLGDRVFGTLGSDEVSQYAIGDDWVQISMNGALCRVTPIDFGGMLKYFATGTTPGYIIVDCNSGEAKLVRSEGMKYMKSAYFFKNLYRRLFFADPTAMYGESKFELNDSGKPYWVTPVYKVTWVGKTRDVKGVMITDPVSGEVVYYDKQKAPAWVDNIYPIRVVYDQFRQSKYYENGLFNWSRKGVVEFTDDYAYVQFDDHVYIYTGVTSVGKDESNVGFAYVNLRDGKITYIRRAGAEEYSARSSAEGAVQQYHYMAIFPSMVSVAGKPTYFMGLVDGANLIKSYAFVSYENYQTVATGATVKEAYQNYLKLIGGNASASGEVKEKTFTVAEVQAVVKDGNTIILLRDENRNLYWYDMSGGDFRASFLKEGSLVRAYVGQDGEISEFTAIAE